MTEKDGSPLGIKTFANFVEWHLTAENSSVPRLKAAIERNGDKDWPAQFKAEFADVIAHHTFSREDYRLLTHSEFESDEDYQAWLRAVWNCLYEGGPDPG